MSSKWLWLPLAIGLASIALAVVYVTYAAQPMAPGADTEIDQSVEFGVGQSWVGGRTGVIENLTYVYPISHDRVSLFLTLGHEDLDGIDSSDLLFGGRAYPFEFPLYFGIGAGAAFGRKSQGLIGGAVGYDVPLSRLWYLAIAGGVVWDRQGQERSTLSAGVGKRF